MDERCVVDEPAQYPYDPAPLTPGKAVFSAMRGWKIGADCFGLTFLFACRAIQGIRQYPPSHGISRYVVRQRVTINRHDRAVGERALRYISNDDGRAHGHNYQTGGIQ